MFGLVLPAFAGVTNENLVFDLGGVKLEMVKIPAGTFRMGSPDTERERDTGEVSHKVTISKDYYIGYFMNSNFWR